MCCLAGQFLDRQPVELRSPDTSNGDMREMQVYVVEEQTLHGVTEELNSNMLCCAGVVSVLSVSKVTWKYVSCL